MKDTIFMFLAFESTHQAIHFEHLLLPHFAIEMIPTPREVTASCGLSLKFEVDDFQMIQKELASENLSRLRVFLYTRDGNGSKAVEVNWG